MQDCAPLPLSLSQLGSRHSSCLGFGLLLLWLLLWLLAWLLHHLFLFQRSCFSRWGVHWHGSWLLLRLTAKMAFIFCFNGGSLRWLSWLLQTLGGTLVFPPLTVFLFLQYQWLIQMLAQHVHGAAGNIADKTDFLKQVLTPKKVYCKWNKRADTATFSCYLNCMTAV